MLQKKRKISNGQYESYGQTEESTVAGILWDLWNRKENKEVLDIRERFLCEIAEKEAMDCWFSVRYPVTKPWKFGEIPSRGDALEAIYSKRLDRMLRCPDYNGRPTITDYNSLVEVAIKVKGDPKRTHHLSKAIKKYFVKEQLQRFLKDFLDEGETLPITRERIIEVLITKLNGGGPTDWNKRCIERENMQNIEEKNFFELCGIIIPIDIMLEIFGFIPKNKNSLDNVGVLNMDWYIFMLKCWGSIRVYSENLFKIPLIVFSNAQIVEIVIGKFKVVDIEYFFKNIRFMRELRVRVNWENPNVVTRFWRVSRKKVFYDLLSRCHTLALSYGPTDDKVSARSFSNVKTISCESVTDFESFGNFICNFPSVQSVKCSTHKPDQILKCLPGTIIELNLFIQRNFSPFSWLENSSHLKFLRVLVLNGHTIKMRECQFFDLSGCVDHLESIERVQFCYYHFNFQPSDWIMGEKTGDINITQFENFEKTLQYLNKVKKKLTVSLSFRGHHKKNFEKNALYCLKEMLTTFKLVHQGTVMRSMMKSAWEPISVCWGSNGWDNYRTFELNFEKEMR